MDREAFRKAGYAAIDRICSYFEEIEQQPVMPQIEPGLIASMIEPAPPTKGEPWAAIEADFDRVILPGITAWQHPSFFAYFPANTTYESILADIYSGAVSNPGFNWACSPSCTELEVKMLDWTAKLLGLDPSWYNSTGVGGGIIMGSASESCLTVCIAARERALTRLSTPTTTPVERAAMMSRFVIYGSTQTHSLGAKAALILGIPFRALEARAEDDWTLRGDTLAAALEEDEVKGLVPFILLATMGTTSTGAIDQLDEITTVGASHPNLFIHLDGAWAGVFLACPEFREECFMDVINRRATDTVGEIHSFCTNLHKSGLVTFDASCLWVRDRKLLTDALDVTPAYLRNKQSDIGAVIDYRNWQIPLGRRFRSLKLFFVLRSYGVEGFQAHLRKLVGLTAQLEQLVLGDQSEKFSLFVPRRLSLLVIRLEIPKAAKGLTNGFTSINLGGTAEDDIKKKDVLNRAFFKLMSERSDIHLTPTVVGGTYCTRIAVGSPYTKGEHIENCWRIIQELSETVRIELEC